MSTNLHPMLNVAIRAARSAGSVINRAALDIEAVRISQKNMNDFVTEVDHLSEKTIIEQLLDAYPNHGILAEESGQQHGNANSDFTWIIDPLDGTTNFIHGFPVYCVSIALRVGDRMEQAVVYDPTRNDLFTATRGRGAYLNERRIRVSKRTRLSECLLSTGFPYRKTDSFNRTLRIIGEVMQQASGVRRPGAAALDLAYVAAGFTDGFFETGLQSWDTAAGSLLVTEAGGLVGNYSGESDFLERGECVAANPRIYGQLVQILQKHSRAAAPAAAEDAAAEEAAAADSQPAADGEAQA